MVETQTKPGRSPRRPHRWMYGGLVLLVFWLPLLFAIQNFVRTALGAYRPSDEPWIDVYIMLQTAVTQGGRLFLVPLVATAILLPVLLGLRRADRLMGSLFQSLDFSWRGVYAQDMKQVLKNGGFYCGELGVCMFIISLRYVGFVAVPWQFLTGARLDGGRLVLEDSAGGTYRFGAAWTRLGAEACLQLLGDKAPWCFGEGSPPLWQLRALDGGRPQYLPRRVDRKAVKTMRRRFARLFAWQGLVMWGVIYVVPCLIVAGVYIHGVRSYPYDLWLSILYTFMEHWVLLFVPMVMWLLCGWLIRGRRRQVELLLDLFESLDERWQELFLQDGQLLRKQKGFYCGQVGVWFFSFTIGREGLIGFCLIPYQQLDSVYRKRSRLLLYDCYGRQYHYKGLMQLQSADSALMLLEQHAPWSLHTATPGAVPIDEQATQPIDDIRLPDEDAPVDDEDMTIVDEDSPVDGQDTANADKAAPELQDAPEAETASAEDEDAPDDAQAEADDQTASPADADDPTATEQHPPVDEAPAPGNDAEDRGVASGNAPAPPDDGNNAPE